MVEEKSRGRSRCTSDLMSKHWRCGPSRSRAATSATRPCCPNCSAKSHQIRMSDRLPLTELTTRANAMTRLPHVGGAHAVIPPRKNAKPWKLTSTGAIARNKAVRTSRYLGKTLWRRWSGYHRRSRVEAKMNCIKLLGQSLMARDFDRQVAGLQVRIAVLNGYSALGRPITETVG